MQNKPKNKKENILLIGGGGHCISCIDVIESTGKYNIIAIVEKITISSKNILNYPILDSDNDLLKLSKKCKNCAITFGPIKNQKNKVDMFNRLKKCGFKLPTIIASTSYISKYASIEEGTIIMHNTFINANAKIGKNNIINTGTIIEHDAVIGNNCNIATGVIINGGCKIGNNIFIGSNSVISNAVNIADNTIIGSGAAVIKSINKDGTYVGVPARRVK